MRAALGIHEQAVFLGIGGGRQDHVGAVCTPIPMAALIDHKGTLADLHLVSAQVVHNFCTIHGRIDPALGHGTHVHRAHTAGSGVQHQHLAAQFFGQRHGLSQNRDAVTLTDGALPDDHDGALLRARVLDQLVQRYAARTGIGIIIGQIHTLGADNRHLGPFGPRLADPSVQHRRLVAWVGPDQNDFPSRINIFNRSIAHIGRPVAGWQNRAVCPAFDRSTQPLHKLPERKHRLDRRQIPHQRGNLLALHRACGGGQRLTPAGGLQFAVHADIGFVQPLTAQTVPDKAGLVGNPFLVHAVMIARQNAHHFTALCVHPDIAAQRIHHVDGFGLGQLPRAGSERIRLGCQRTHRAQIDDVALQVRNQRLIQIAGDLGILAPAGLAHLGDAGHLCGKAHASRTADAAGHRGRHKRAKVQIVHRALGFLETCPGHAIGHGLVLQVALAALIADRAIQRVVDQHEFHHAFAGLLDHGRVGLDHRRLAFGARTQVAHLHGAGGCRLRRPAHNLDKAHPAVAGDRQPLVIAKAWNLHPGLFTGLDQGHRALYFDFRVVDDDLA